VSLEDVPGIYTPEGLGKIFVRRDNLHRAIEEMVSASATAVDAPAPMADVATPQRAPKAQSEDVEQSGPGAPEQYHWDDAFKFMRDLLDKRGDPKKPENRVRDWRSNADVARAVMRYLEGEWEEFPDFKHTERVIRPELKNWRKEQEQKRSG
jgi:hypothetical protein